MKSSISRTLAAAAIAAVLTFPFAPIAAAGPRDQDDLASRIVHVVKKLQRLFGVSAQDNEPVPPRP